MGNLHLAFLTLISPPTWISYYLPHLMIRLLCIYWTSPFASICFDTYIQPGLMCFSADLHPEVSVGGMYLFDDEEEISQIFDRYFCDSTGLWSFFIRDWSSLVFHVLHLYKILLGWPVFLVYKVEHDLMTTATLVQLLTVGRWGTRKGWCKDGGKCCRDRGVGRSNMGMGWGQGECLGVGRGWG